MLILPSFVLATMLFSPAQATEQNSDSYLAARQTVKNHFLAEHFDQAARGFEALWEKYQRLPDLYAAGLARYRLEHHAHAVEHWERFLELAATTGFEDPKVERTMHQLEDAQTRVFPQLILIETPEGFPAASAEIAVQSDDSSRPPIRRSIDIEAGTNNVSLRLDRGSWTVSASINGKTQVVQIKVPSNAPGSIVLSKPVVLPRPIRKRLSLGLSLPGIALAGAGAGILFSTQYGRYKHAKDKICASSTINGCTMEFKTALRTRDIGAQVMGGGAGLLISGLTTLAPKAKGRRIAWIAQAAIGGSLAAAGATLYLTRKQQTAELLKLTCNPESPYCERPQSPELKDTGWDFKALSQPGTMHLVNSILLGTGAGLLTGATIGLLVQRPYLRKQTREKISSISVSPNLSSQNTGLLISGAF